MTQSGLVVFGEVLFDCFPDGSRVLGGAPFNVAWHSQAFGLQPLFISRVGNDPLGHEVKSAMQQWGMNTSGLQLDSTHPTGIVDVSFHEGEPSYDIVENSACDFIQRPGIPEVNEHNMLYHGSLAMRNQVTASTLANLKNDHSGSTFVDVNLRSPWWDNSLIDRIISNNRWIKLNIDELALIVPQHDNTESRIKYLLTTFNPELIVVTQGKAGAIAATQDSWCSVTPNYSEVVDTVGAGDAFSSVLLLGIYHEWPLQEILNRAQQFASAIVGQRGATTQEKLFYEPFINAWGLT